jgi:hypothetical protein
MPSRTILTLRKVRAGSAMSKRDGVPYIYGRSIFVDAADHIAEWPSPSRQSNRDDPKFCLASTLFALSGYWFTFRGFMGNGMPSDPIERAIFVEVEKRVLNFVVHDS